MGEINVTSTKQKIIVDPASYSVSIIYTGVPKPIPGPPAPSTPLGLTIATYSEVNDVNVSSAGLYDVLMSQWGQKAPYALKVIIGAHIYFGYSPGAVNAGGDLWSGYHNASVQGSGAPVQAPAAAWTSLPFNIAYDVPKGGELGKKLRLNITALNTAPCYIASRMVTQYIQTGV